MSRVLCNPLDLAYRYQDVRFSGIVGEVSLGPARRSVHREAADPSVVRYRDRYYLFASMSMGFWHSADLFTWDFCPTAKLPPFDYAPDVREVDGALIVSASRKDVDSPFFRSVDPLTDDFEEISPGHFPFWDPNLFQDHDGRVYLYWGCDNVLPLYGVQLDSDLRPVGEPVELVHTDVDRRGWEQVGEDYHVPEPATELERRIAQFTGTSPYLEGAWMTRRGGTYYLQYAAPGTQWNTYADGYLTASHPLGPFSYSPRSPFSSKPGGFISGAGHGSTFQDVHGNWWHAATMRISVNDIFERRIGIFPAGFDEQGALFCNQDFADYPLVVPEGQFNPRTLQHPQWMLLSYRAQAIASSSAEGHLPALAADEDVRTWWASAGSGAGEWLRLDLGTVVDVRVVQVNLADHDVARVAERCRNGADSGHTWRGIHTDHAPAEVRVEGSVDGNEWVVLHDGAGSGEDRPHALIAVEGGRALRHIRVQAVRLPFDGHFAVSGLRVFGRGSGIPPAAVEPDAVRVDDRTAHLEWPGSEGAHGYNVRYGGAPDALYRSWLVYERTALQVPSLNADEETWFAVDSFNENGVTRGRAILARPNQE